MTSALQIPPALSTRRRVVPLVALVLVVLLLASMCGAVAIGSAGVPLETVLTVIARRLRLSSGTPSLLDDQIVWQLRLPRVVAAAATGAGLALVGAVLQSVTRNSLADPYILGVSGGASVGAVTVIVLGVSVAGLIGPAAIAAGAFVGAMLALLAVFALATSRAGTLAPTRTLLAGVAVGQLCGAYTSFLVIARGDGDAARRALSWSLGSVAGVRWSSALVLVVAVVVTLVVVSAFAGVLDTFAFGEVAARSLGVSVEATRWSFLVGTALLTAVLVSATGAIGFVGLVVPHVVRMLLGPLHGVLIPISALVGAVFMVWADTVARTVVTGQELPIGVVTAAVGAPVFAVILRREASR